METTSQLRSLPTEILANIVSFVTIDTTEISELLGQLLPSSKNQNGIDINFDNDEESIYRALCLLYWDSVKPESRPYFISWKVLYRVLSEWVHRQGFYTILEAAPWGMLLRLKFDVGGHFVGDLLWPKEEVEEENISDDIENNEDGLQYQNNYAIHNNNSRCPSSSSILNNSCFRSIRILHIRFDNHGSIDEISICNENVSRDRVSIFHPNNEEDDVVVEPLIIPGCPVNYAGVRSIKIQKDSSNNNGWDNFFVNLYSSSPGLPELIRLWDPMSPTHPDMLLKSLFTYGSQLTLDWVEGPSKCSPSFAYREEMPLIKPGLYSGVYENMYGKFKREIILIEYIQYELQHPQNDDGTDNDSSTHHNSKVWENIRCKIFNHPDQTDSQNRFETIQRAVTESKSKTLVFVLGKKVTGDIHVPMKQITFGALVSPIVSLNDDRVTLSRVTDRGGVSEGLTTTTTKEYHVIRSWDGWGTLSYPTFRNPSWASGTLVQVVSVEQQQQQQNANPPPEQFGFVWQSQDRDPHASILTRMTEQDEFPWFC